MVGGRTGTQQYLHTFQTQCLQQPRKSILLPPHALLQNYSIGNSVKYISTFVVNLILKYKYDRKLYKRLRQKIVTFFFCSQNLTYSLSKEISFTRNCFPLPQPHLPRSLLYLQFIGALLVQQNDRFRAYNKIVPSFTALLTVYFSYFNSSRLNNYLRPTYLIQL